MIARTLGSELFRSGHCRQRTPRPGDLALAALLLEELQGPEARIQIIEGIYFARTRAEADEPSANFSSVELARRSASRELFAITKRIALPWGDRPEFARDAAFVRDLITQEVHQQGLAVRSLKNSSSIN